MAPSRNQRSQAVGASSGLSTARQTQISRFFRQKVPQDDSSVAPDTHASPARLSGPVAQLATSPIDLTDRARFAGGTTSSRLAALGRGWPASQQASFQRETPRSHERSSNTRQAAIIRENICDDKQEEIDWLERARKLKKQGKARVTSELDGGVVSQPGPPSASASASASTPSPSRRERSRPSRSSGETDDSDIEMLQTPARPKKRREWPSSSQATTPASVQGDQAGCPAASPESPSQQTPFLHQSLSEFSMLPWELEAQRKAPQYRISAGLKPTAKDLEAKQRVERAAAEEARRKAIARSFGAENVKEAPPTEVGVGSRRPAAEAGKPWPPTDRTPCTKSVAMSEQPPSLKRAVALAPCSTPRKRLALSPRLAPNAQSEPPKAACLPLGSPDPSPHRRPLRPLHSASGARKIALSRVSPSRDRPSSPCIKPLAALRSPRSGRKVYALETQANGPDDVSRDRLQRNLGQSPQRRGKALKMHRHGLESSSGPSRADLDRLPRLPSDSVQRQAILDSFGGSSPLTSEGPEEDAKGEAQERPVEPQATQPPSLRPSGRIAASTPQRETSPRVVRRSPAAASASKGRAGGPMSPSQAVRGKENHPLTSPTPSTQLIDSDYDDDDDDDDNEDDTVVAVIPPSVHRRRSPDAADSESADRVDDPEMTQPLAFTESERLPAASHGCKTTGIPLADSGGPSAPRLTAWSQVNDAWAGMKELPRRHSAKQATLGQYGFPEADARVSKRKEAQSDASPEPRAAPAPGWADHPLSRDLRDELSEGDDSDHEAEREIELPQRSPMKSQGPKRSLDRRLSLRSQEAAADSQATQPLAWTPSQTASSHTEDETQPWRTNARDGPPRLGRHGSSDVIPSSSPDSWLPTPSPVASRRAEMENFWNRL
ncbi:unnamed protein product [Parajaminaea phylloscopi]